MQTTVRQGLAFKRLTTYRTLQTYQQLIRHKTDHDLAMEKFGGICYGNTGEGDIYLLVGRGKIGERSMELVKFKMSLEKQQVFQRTEI